MGNPFGDSAVSGNPFGDSPSVEGNPFGDLPAARPSDIAKEALSKPATGKLDPLLMLGQGLVDIGAMAGEGAAQFNKAFINPLLPESAATAMESSADAFASSAKRASGILEEGKSSSQQVANKALTEAKGVGGVLTAAAEKPSAIADQLVRAVPSMLGMAAVVRKAFTLAAEKVLAAGATHEAATAAGLAAAGTANVASNAAVEGLSTGSDTRATVTDMPEVELRKSPRYQELLQTMTPGEARHLLAQNAAEKAVLLAGGIGGAATLVTGAGAMEVRALTTGLTKKAVESTLFSKVGGLAKAVGKETAEEALQSGGNVLGQNVGIISEGVREGSVWEGVPEGATAGGLVGGLMGGGYHAVGHLNARNSKLEEIRQTATTELQVELEKALAGGGEGDLSGAVTPNYSAPQSAPILSNPDLLEREMAPEEVAQAREQERRLETGLANVPENPEAVADIADLRAKFTGNSVLKPEDVQAKVDDLVGDLDPGMSREVALRRLETDYPNRLPHDQREVTAASNPEAVGLTLRQYKMQPGDVLTLGGDVENFPPTVKFALTSTVKTWTDKWMPGSRVILNLDTFTDNTVGAYGHLASGIHVITPRELVHWDQHVPDVGADKIAYNKFTQQQTLYALTHEFGHALVMQRFAERLPEGFANILDEMDQGRMLSGDEMLTLPVEQASVLAEYQMLRGMVLGGKFTAADWMEKWAGTWKAGKALMKVKDLKNKSLYAHAKEALALDGKTFEGATALDLIHAMGRDNNVSEEVSNQRSEAYFLSFQEYMAEQFSRYAYSKRIEEGTPLGRFFQKALDTLRNFFREMKTVKGISGEAVIKPGTSFEQWVEGLAHTAQILEGVTPEGKTAKAKAKREKTKVAKANAAGKVDVRGLDAVTAKAVEANQGEPLPSTQLAQSPVSQDMLRVLVKQYVLPEQEEYKRFLGMITRGQLEEVRQELQSFIEDTMKKDIDLNKGVGFPEKAQAELAGLSEEEFRNPTVVAQASALWKKLGTKSPFFKRFFGDWERGPMDASKVVDANGEPLALWHGGPIEFEFFDHTLQGGTTYARSAKRAIFFTQLLHTAEYYADLASSTGKGSAYSVVQQAALMNTFAEEGYGVDFGVTTSFRAPGGYGIPFSELPPGLQEIFDSVQPEGPRAQVVKPELGRQAQALRLQNRALSAQLENVKVKQTALRDKIIDLRGAIDNPERVPGTLFQKVLAKRKAESVIAQYEKQLRTVDAEFSVLLKQWGEAHKAAKDFQSDPKNHTNAVPTVGKYYLDMRNPLIVDEAIYNDNLFTEMLDQAVADGHDGVIIKNAADPHPGDTIYMIFDPEQIKAENNVGTFDKTDSLFWDKENPEGLAMYKAAGKLAKMAKGLGLADKTTQALHFFHRAQDAVIQVQQKAFTNGNDGLQLFNIYLQKLVNMKNALLRFPDEIVKRWEKVSFENNAKLSKMLQDEFLSGGHVTELVQRNGVWVHEAGAAYKEWSKSHGFDPESALGLEMEQLFLDVKNSLLKHIGTLEEVAIGIARERFSNAPQALQLRVNEIRGEARKWRNTPFIPQTRFGRFVVWVKGRNPETGRIEVVHREHFETKAERQRAAREMTKLLKPGETLKEKELDDTTYVVLSLPKDFLQTLADTKEFSDEQLIAIGEAMTSNKGSKLYSRYERAGDKVRGASSDLMRNFAHWSWHNANFIAKLEHRRRFNNAIAMTRSDITQVQKSSLPIEEKQRQIHELDRIVGIMSRAREYLMHPPEEFFKTRATVSLLYLMYSIKTAAMNLTGMLQTWAAVTSEYGDVRGNALFAKASKDLISGNLSDAERWMLDKALTDGVVDQSYAYFLAGQANAGNLVRMTKNTLVGNAWRTFTDLGMKPFQLIEMLNRRLTMLMVFRGELQNGLAAGLDLTDARTEAYSEAERKTRLLQNDFATGNRPEMLRGKKSIFFIFFSYMQHMLWLMSGGYERGVRAGQLARGETPRSMLAGFTVRMWLIFALLGGAEGVPGGSNILDLLEWVWRKMFKGQNLRVEMRKMVEGAGMDSNLALHGLSHNLGGFDLSGSLSLGRPIPGTDVLTRTGQRPEEKVGQLATALPGPLGGVVKNALGLIFSEEPIGKRLAHNLPGAAGSVAKAIEYSLHGAETRQGASLTVEDSGEKRDLTGKEIVGQAMGFRPAILAKNQEIHALKVEEHGYWTKRREGLTRDYWEAVHQKDQQGRLDVQKAVQEFNAEVPSPSLRISGKDLFSAIKSRQKAVSREEHGLSGVRKFAPIDREIEGLVRNDSTGD